MVQKWLRRCRPLMRLTVLLGLGLTACPVPEKLPGLAEPRAMLEPQHISPQLNAVTSVAVLPFEQVQGESQGVEVVRRSFYNNLSSKKFRDVELYRVDALLRSQGLSTTEALAKATPQELAKLLGVDAVIYGKVTTYGRYLALTASAVRVGLHVTMRDGRDGTVLWDIAHTTTDFGGGVPTPDPLSALTNLIDATLKLRDIQLLRSTDLACRKIVTSLPDPTLSAALKSPTITALGQNTGGNPRKAGESIKVVMIGDPGHHATFHIGNFRRDLPMVEGPPGTYVGTYQVRPGDQVQEALVTGYLTDERGNRSQRVDVFGSVTIDTVPPAAPRAVDTAGRDAAVNIAWKANDEPDLAGYRLYRSVSPLSGYVQAQQVEETEARDVKLTNFQPYYYQVTAFDRAGNESRRSEPVLGMPVKPGPTNVVSDIGDDTTWYAGASPYVLTRPVTIRTGVTLTLEPGVTVESSGGGLQVRGSLIAMGTPAALIVFRRHRPSEGATTWDGIIFDNTGTSDNRLAYVKIQDASVAIRMVSSSPDIRHAMVTNNDTGLIVTELSEPHIEATAITNNRADGVMSQNAAPIMTRNTITHNAGNGVTLAASTPIFTENNIHSNARYQLTVAEKDGSIVNTQNNWWGTTDREQLQRLISGPVSYAKILDAPYPQGKSMPLPTPARPAPTPPPTSPSPPASAVSDLLAQGGAALEQNQLADALSAFQQVISLQPDNHRAQFRVGVIYYQLGQLTDALHAMQQAVALQPDDVGYRYHLGLVYSELNMPSKAIAAWEHVLAINPGHRNARMLLNFEKRHHTP